MAAFDPFDPFDRTTAESKKVGTAQAVSTRYTFVGLGDQVALEEQKDTAGAYKVTKSYAYGATGENLSLTDTPINTTTSKKSFYGTNPHSDVGTLTDSTGQTTSTYRYTAYGQTDKTGTTGEDAITGVPAQDADVVNPYRFNSKRINGATGTYDMGFREYNPSLNRFLSRDMYAGALKDMTLGSGPWNTNRYMFGGGNPISRIELDGHLSSPEGEGSGGFIGASLEICGADCSLDFSDGIKIVDPSPGDSFNDAIDNGLVGAVEGVIETGEQVSPITPSARRREQRTASYSTTSFRRPVPLKQTAPPTKPAASSGPCSSPPDPSASPHEPPTEQPSPSARRPLQRRRPIRAHSPAPRPC
ncbi:RHS repeat-associated core domain-containing protein [Kribbella sp. NPDC023855]|uniref:RHS repeat-associated core domain-containing protein n=1 Tax=Kribbella sp. NPDC023855 TaxID=3154698 RepID=UPI0033F39E57